MTLKQNIKRQCQIYIDALIAGIDGDLVRTHTHQELERRLPDNADPDSLPPILHNLDQAIGFDMDLIGKWVPEKQRKRYGNLLFRKIWKLYLGKT